MNLLKKILSAGLSLSVLLSGAPCLCAEPNQADSVGNNVATTDGNVDIKKGTKDNITDNNKTKPVEKRDNNARERLARWVLAYCIIECGVMKFQLDRARRDAKSARRELDRIRNNGGNLAYVQNGSTEMYILQLRLTEAMLAKVDNIGNIEAHRNLDICRQYLLAKLSESALPGVHNSPAARANLQQLENSLNAIRHELYEFDGNGNVVVGADLDEPRDDLVMCNVTQTYYLPVDIQYCGDMRVDDDGTVNVHGVSTQAAANWVRAGHPNDVCVTCQQAANYVVPGVRGNQHDYVYNAGGHNNVRIHVDYPIE